MKVIRPLGLVADKKYVEHIPGRPGDALDLRSVFIVDIPGVMNGFHLTCAVSFSMPDGGWDLVPEPAFSDWGGDDGRLSAFDLRADPVVVSDGFLHLGPLRLYNLVNFSSMGQSVAAALQNLFSEIHDQASKSAGSSFNPCSMTFRYHCSDHPNSILTEIAFNDE